MLLTNLYGLTHLEASRDFSSVECSSGPTFWLEKTTRAGESIRKFAQSIRRVSHDFPRGATQRVHGRDIRNLLRWSRTCQGAPREGAKADHYTSFLPGCSISLLLIVRINFHTHPRSCARRASSSRHNTSIKSVSPRDARSIRGSKGGQMKKVSGTRGRDDTIWATARSSRFSTKTQRPRVYRPLSINEIIVAIVRAPVSPPFASTLALIKNRASRATSQLQRSRVGYVCNTLLNLFVTNF